MFRKPFFKASIIFFSASLFQSLSQSACPPYPVGIHVVKDGGKKSYYATAVVNIDDTRPDSLDFAKAQVRALARTSLKKHIAPNEKTTKFSGLIDIDHCIVGTKMYAVVGSNEINEMRALGLKNAIRDSIKSKPALDVK